MTGTQLRGLKHKLTLSAHRGFHLFVAKTNNGYNLIDLNFFQIVKDMPQHWFLADRVHHLRQLRVHACTLARRHNNCRFHYPSSSIVYFTQTRPLKKA